MSVQISPQLKAAAQKAATALDKEAKVRLDPPFDSFFVTKIEGHDVFATIESSEGNIFLICASQ